MIFLKKCNVLNIFVLNLFELKYFVLVFILNLKLLDKVRAIIQFKHCFMTLVQLV